MDVQTLQDLRVLVMAQRKALKLSQEELAERAGVSRRWISMFENGHEAAEVGRLLAVLNALDLQLSATTTGPTASTDIDDAVDLREALRGYDDGDF